MATATADATQSTTSYSEINFYDAYKRYWDEAYGREAKLSVYAIAVPGKTEGSKAAESLLAAPEESRTWSSADLSHNVAWNISPTQDKNTIDSEDLIYSNNIYLFIFTFSIAPLDA